MSIVSATYFNGRLMNTFRQTVLALYIKMNSSTKVKTHYESLEISPNATHNDIKSAYYKLTLKYHPDRNDSTSAKDMFQEISTAYEILGNYKSRREYDRTIAIKSGQVNQIQKSKMTDMNTTSVPTSTTYDFDAWTRAHYRTGFKYHQVKKEIYAQDEVSKQERMIFKRQFRLGLNVGTSLTILLLVVMVIMDKLFNKDIPINRSNNEVK